MIGLVMLFHQQRNATDEVKMQALTQELVEAAIALQGRYYLPYRLHASLDQFHRAIPRQRLFSGSNANTIPMKSFKIVFMRPMATDSAALSVGADLF
ncbi:MAG: hypothetical protein HC824_06735 [Synechococcales cyanobacterium RM1_1_8]|nr:hypothetical protein [Synechococcales cyanobacterium RM1_1_8]